MGMRLACYMLKQNYLYGNLFTKNSIQHPGFDSCLEWYSACGCYLIWQCSPVVIELLFLVLFFCLPHLVKELNAQLPKTGTMVTKYVTSFQHNYVQEDLTYHFMWQLCTPVAIVLSCEATGYHKPQVIINPFAFGIKLQQTCALLWLWCQYIYSIL